MLQNWIVKKTARKINRCKNKSSKNCAQNKALQKCAADIFVYLLVERGKALSAALLCAIGCSLMRSMSSRERFATLH